MEYRDGTRCVWAGLPEPVPGQPFLPGPVFAGPYHLDPSTERDPEQDTYGRVDNPTRRALESAIGSLEGGECLTFASGQSAVTGLLLTLLRPGDTVVLPADGYYQARAFGTAALRPMGVATIAVPTAGPYPDFTGVRLVLLETPANPGLDVCDIAKVAASAREAGALVVVDNTTATPLGQRPLALGADIVVGSGSKALTGHSDLLIGYVATRHSEILEQVRAWRNRTGGVPGGFDCWLAHRSLGTLDLRLTRQSLNAAAAAALLATRDDVTGVRWPGLPEDPSHPIASRQMRRMPGLVAFDLETADRATAFLAACRLVRPATSFGGLHTTVDRRANWGDQVGEGFIRLSCGIEDTDDLVADLTQALDAAGPFPGLDAAGSAPGLDEVSGNDGTSAVPGS